jgi:hypothetical protein
VQYETYSFVVRIWQEAVDGDGTILAWRGSIDDVGNAERSYFSDLDSIAPFIQRQIGVERRAAPSGLEAGGDQEQA